MSKVGIIVITVLLLFGLAFLFTSNTTAPTTDQTSPTPTSLATPNSTTPTDEQAELTAFGFIQDFIKTAPPDVDQEAAQRAYDALSRSAKENVSMETISKDLAAFVGVQDVPDQGASVEDLQVDGDTATLTVGLNYSGSGRVLKDVNLVVEDGMWKVDDIM